MEDRFFRSQGKGCNAHIKLAAVACDHLIRPVHGPHRRIDGTKTRISKVGARLKERLRHFGSRRAMGLDGLGGAAGGRLVDRGLVRDVADLYRLRAPRVARLPGFARKSAENLVGAIAASRRRGLERLLDALGVPGVGAHVARLLAARFGTLDGLARASRAELARVPGIGPVLARSVVDQALNRYSNIICMAWIIPTSGPGTETHLIETALRSIEAAINGANLYAPRHSRSS